MSSIPVRGPLTHAESRALALALGERSEYTIARHHLLRGSATAFCVGDPQTPVAALVQPYDGEAEPLGLGQDVAALYALLQVARNWTCVEVEVEIASALADLLSSDTSQPCRLYGDLYYRLERPAMLCPHPAVRLLTLDDEPLLATAPQTLQGTGWRTRQGLLREGVIACALVGGAIVASAFTVAMTPGHAEIGVETLPEHRGQGYATAAAGLVAVRIQARGLTPTWSTGQDNWASQRVATKLGFRRCYERTYIIPQR